MSEKKNILITGATSGIGLEVARYLFETGYGIIMVGRNKDKLIEVSRQINNSRYVVVDLEKTETIKKIFDYCKTENIKLDGMVHSAGYTINMPIRSYKIEHMERQMRVHYYAFIELCKFFYGKNISNERASIVAVSSLASALNQKGSAFYSGSKNALNSAVSVASKEFVKRGIRVNGILPAYVDTRLIDGLEEIVDIKDKQPMGIIPPCDIAYIIEFLLSEKSKYITGALIPISAGMFF